MSQALHRDTAGRLRELDLLRGGAALWVVLFHYVTRYDTIYGTPAAGRFEFPDGLFGVQLFFMISGFVIFMTLRRARTGWDFVVSRVSRLYPAYWAAVLITFTVGALWPLPDQHHQPMLLFANLSMLQAYVFIPAVDGVYWSLAVELGFYTVMLALFLLGILDRIIAIGFVWLALALLAHSPAGSWLHLPYRLTLLLALDYANLFIAGIVFYELWTKGYAHSRLTLLASCLVAQLLFEGLSRGSVTMIFFGLFYLAISGRASTLCVRPLLWLGNISYSLYLTHQMLGYKIIATLRAAGMNNFLSIAIALAFALALASTMTFLIEQPARRLLRRALTSGTEVKSPAKV